MGPEPDAPAVNDPLRPGDAEPRTDPDLPGRVPVQRHDAAGAVLGPLDFETAVALGERLPRPLVFTNGVFDLLHAGHVDCLEAACRLGRSLVVGLNTDASVRRQHGGAGKGIGRPFQAQDPRARVLAALRAVTAVVLFDEATPLKLIEALRPEVYVKGGDYAAASLQEAALVAHWGGRTVIVPRRRPLSTSGLVQQVLGAHGAAGQAAWRPT
jgi:rfaE bifunctional protein nucleotidyltransferase chain/domain